MEHAVKPDWVALLRARGHRLTEQRRLVLDAVAELGHATAEQLTEAVHRTSPTVNATTVYRTLDLLEELGLVAHSHLGSGHVTTYSLAGPHPHAHTRCRRCGRVVELPHALGDALAAGLAAEGFEVDLSHLAVLGVCRVCPPSPG